MTFEQAAAANRHYLSETRAWAAEQRRAAAAARAARRPPRPPAAPRAFVTVQVRR